jgi:hypothetical protein
MKRLEARHVGEFSATGADGRQYTVHEFRTYTHVAALSGATETLEGMPSFKLADGGHVNKVSNSELQIVATGVKLTRT